MKDDQILDSWKEITEYLGRSRKTCLRWEKEFDLPIHRLDGTPKARVFAYKDELDRWLKETLKGKEQPKKKFPIVFSSLKLSSQSMKFIIPALVFVLTSIAVAIWFFSRQSKIRWAQEVAIPEIERLSDEDSYPTAYQIALEAAKYIPDNQTLEELMQTVTGSISIESTPSGADVYIKNHMVDEWMFLGQSPLNDAETSRGYNHWKVIKPGYDTMEGAIYLDQKDSWEFKITLDQKGTMPTDMAHINAVSYSIPNSQYPTLNRDFEYTPKLSRLRHLKPAQVGEYLLDKHEVTNEQYKEFIDSGGYRKKEYWKHEFIKDGQTLTWEEAMKEFADSTGRPGPSTWALGDYPEGQDDYPVSGISWYEAAAYAEFVGKSLPTVYHWSFATGIYDNLTAGYLESAYIVPNSNFKEKGPSPAGKFQGLSPHGNYDMAGNVKEWCWNAIEDRRFILGGAWDEPQYMFNYADNFPPFFRAHNFGVRCMRYLSENDAIDDMSIPVEVDSPLMSIPEPCSDEIFRIYKSLYDYGETELDPVAESREEWTRHTIMEKVSINAAYGKERMIAYLFLPRNGKPPFQTVIYWPGSGAYIMRSIQDYGLKDKFEWLTKHSRAVVWPVYKGTFERPHNQIKEYTYVVERERIIMQVKDLGRTIDYLEVREEFDHDKIAAFGISGGANWFSEVPAIEKRIKATIVMGGGFSSVSRRLAEISQFNFTPRVKIPVLMLSGKYDYAYPGEQTKLLFQLFGTPEEDKHLKIYETGHAIWYKNEWKRDALDFLDKYFGPPYQGQ
jgi:formylglycine-generating enzyme required for sulfatase activity/dienelactone hydrolase